MTLPRLSSKSLNDWLHHIGTVHHRDIEMGLERVCHVLSAMGLNNPGFKTILIGGTNGKGSSVALLHQILSEQGYRVGAYTSPHLVHYNERVQIAERLATDSELVCAFDAIENARGDIPLTYFEFGTLAAVKLFHDQGMDVALMEVGMGGRLDAVNTLDPVATLLTNVGLDHQAWLGETREEIGREKAGIFRPCVAAVCADPDVPESVLIKADKIQTPLALVDRDYHWNNDRDSWNWRYGDQSGRFPKPSLKGGFQVGNAAAVITLLSTIREQIPVSREAIIRGLKSVRLHGRLQILSESPLRIADVAHNRESVQALAEYLRSLKSAGRILAVTGILNDKPMGEMFQLMADVVDEWWFGSLHDKRGATAGQLAKSQKLSAPDVASHCHSSVVDAWLSAQANQKPDDVLVIFGSFYSVGDILSIS